MGNVAERGGIYERGRSYHRTYERRFVGNDDADPWTFLFTDEKFIFTGGLLGVSNFAVKYSDIKELKLVNVGGLIPIIPTGIKVTCLNPENGKTVKHKCSVMKRKEWMEYLRKKAGL